MPGIPSSWRVHRHGETDRLPCSIDMNTPQNPNDDRHRLPKGRACASLRSSWGGRRGCHRAYPITHICTHRRHAFQAQPPLCPVFFSFPLPMASMAVQVSLPGADGGQEDLSLFLFLFFISLPLAVLRVRACVRAWFVRHDGGRKSDVRSSPAEPPPPWLA